MKKIILIVILLFVLIFSKNVSAALKLNEIYPAPSSGEYEWIELYNDENQTINISQYQLLDLAGNKIKISTQSALPFGFVLATSSSVLNNTGDTISFKNNLGEIIEVATYSANFDSNKTFAKCPDFNGNWFVLNMTTKNASNEIACQSLTPTPTLTLTPILIISPTIGTDDPSPTEIQTPTSTPIPQSYDNIYISEVMANPVTGEKEWVEIYNNNDFSVSLNNWYIDDLENAGSSPKVFSLEIGAKSYGVFDLPSSIFNNDGDTVRLLDFNKNLKGDFEYGKSEQGKTLGRTSFESDDFCLQKPSKNSANNPCINPTPTPIDVQTPKLGVSTNPTQAPTKIIQTKIPTVKANNFDVSIHRSINYPTGIVKNNSGNGDVLGVTNELIINSPNNKSLINLLTILSTSYSLLTIISILFKMKLHYGKNKNFYSPSLR
ncbi:MAG: lamin tail domain-containing protein, partial [Patescibacteria group bacterium]